MARCCAPTRGITSGANICARNDPAIRKYKYIYYYQFLLKYFFKISVWIQSNILSTTGSLGSGASSSRGVRRSAHSVRWQQWRIAGDVGGGTATTVQHLRLLGRPPPRHRTGRSCRNVGRWTRQTVGAPLSLCVARSSG